MRPIVIWVSSIISVRLRHLTVPVVLPPLSPVDTLFLVPLSEKPVFESVDDLVDKVAVGGGIPSSPEGGVAAEAVAGGGGRMVVVGEVNSGGGGGGAGEKVGQNFLVLDGEGGGDGQDRRREVGERKLLGDGRMTRMDCSCSCSCSCSFAVEFVHC